MKSSRVPAVLKEPMCISADLAGLATSTPSDAYLKKSALIDKKTFFEAPLLGSSSVSTNQERTLIHSVGRVRIAAWSFVAWFEVPPLVLGPFRAPRTKAGQILVGGPFWRQALPEVTRRFPGG
jgi:hypothetical protein